MSKNIITKELIFKIAYNLLIIVLLLIMLPKAKNLEVYKPSQNNNSLSSEVAKSGSLTSNDTIIIEPLYLIENDGYEYETTEIEIDRINKLEVSRSSSRREDEDYQKALTISKSTPLDFDTSKIIVKYCNKLDLKPSLVLALIDLESNFDQYVVGSSNDRGYCQVILCTEKWLANTYGHILGLEYNPDRIFEPEYNIGLGMLYLHILKQAYGEDYHRILSEYNRGYYNLGKYYLENQTYVTTYSRGVLSRERKFEELN